MGATYPLAVLGSTVRVTESGTGWKGWPLCDGRIGPVDHFHDGWRLVDSSGGARGKLTRSVVSHRGQVLPVVAPTLSSLQEQILILLGVGLSADDPGRVTAR